MLPASEADAATLRRLFALLYERARADLRAEAFGDDEIAFLPALDMRYAGPREGLLHGVFRQNFGCTHMIIGRDHAGVGNYYGPMDAQDIWSDVPNGALEIRMLPIDWTFWCYKCGGMISMKTCPHGKEDRLFLSGTALRKGLSEGADIPDEFSRPEVLKILRDYYAGLSDEDNVEVKLHNAATGDKEDK